MKIFTQKHCDLKLIKSKKVAIIGFGNQGAAHALNLRDSGVKVIIGARKNGSSAKKAKKMGFEVFSIKKASKKANFIMITLPDEIHQEIYEQEIKPNLKPKDTIAFAHGFSINYNLIKPQNDINVVLIAPKGPGKQLRSEYENRRGLASLIAVFQDFTHESLELAKSYANAIGSGKIGILHTTFKEETHTDLFGEQAVLCGGVMEMAKAGFDTLIKAGYAPEMAYFECIHELKLVVDLLYKYGFVGEREAISNTAEFGGMLAGKKIINKKAKKRMQKILKNIENGKFAKKLIAEKNAKFKNMLSHRAKDKTSLAEKTGEKIRKLINIEN